MADTEFEEFRRHFERLPQHIKASAHVYTLVHDVSPDAGSPSPPDGAGRSPGHVTALDAVPPPPPPPPLWGDTGQRRRRRLPEIPKNHKSTLVAAVQPSLADELGGAGERPDSLQFALGACARPLVVLKCRPYLRDEDSSPDSEFFHSTDVDSGNSTAHSPDGPKSMSPQLATSAPCRCESGSPSPPSPASSASVPYTQLELLEATHRGLHKFVPRHRDELELEIGDPIYVQKEADDLWCEGVNLRSGVQGIFPSAYVVDMDYSDFDPSTPKVKRERFLLGYLGSVETRQHKGSSVLCQAVRKIVGPSSAPKHKPHSCILEVSDQGLRMLDKRKPTTVQTFPRDVPCHDYFYSLKNVSFCAFHPRDHRYLGFITKHPQFQRFACHVFMGCESTRPVAEAIGRAFQRFYTKFIETAYPIEDIYIE
ncbi:JNK-interacting protein 1 [Bacillus rossius redtenbacheri]|uniref:JNK-interacting protein 1 n=1 Tax=Bacillus rossius redtenbacheri TaxID=93214 RepID=UPI002FDDB6F4